jgi:hypothetical protein
MNIGCNRRGHPKTHCATRPAQIGASNIVTAALAPSNARDVKITKVNTAIQKSSKDRHM